MTVVFASSTFNVSCKITKNDNVDNYVEIGDFCHKTGEMKNKEKKIGF